MAPASHDSRAIGMTDSRDSEKENSASERASSSHSEMPESEIHRIGFPNRSSAQIYYIVGWGSTLRKKTNRMHANWILPLRQKFTMHGYMLSEPYADSAKVKSACSLGQTMALATWSVKRTHGGARVKTTQSVEVSKHRHRISR